MLAGRAWGARNPTRARAVAGTALALVLAVGLIVSVIGGLTAPMLLKALDTPPEILDDAVRYARVMLVGAPLIFLLWLAVHQPGRGRCRLAHVGADPGDWRGAVARPR